MSQQTLEGTDSISSRALDWRCVIARKANEVSRLLSQTLPAGDWTLHPENCGVAPGFRVWVRLPQPENYFDWLRAEELRGFSPHMHSTLPGGWASVRFGYLPG